MSEQQQQSPHELDYKKGKVKRAENGLHILVNSFLACLLGGLLRLLLCRFLRGGGGGGGGGFLLLLLCRGGGFCVCLGFGGLLFL